MNLSQFELFK